MVDILRFITAGNVDDGKSTLIGRLLYDTGSVKTDVLQSVSSDDEVNLAHITDGLRHERAQGITIDVAYKYFTTVRRKYIVIDAPGHFQYTRNLVTGASGADVMIILVDACNGITEQTRRHSMVASFLDIRQVIVAVNKMDAVGYAEDVFLRIRQDYEMSIASVLEIAVTFIPISALKGDNVISPSANMPWCNGATLLQWLEEIVPEIPETNVFRFNVQYVWTDGGTQFCFGRVISGMVGVGDHVSIFPGSGNCFVRKLIVDKVLEREIAYAGENACLFMESEQEIVRGDILGDPLDSPQVSTDINVMLCWLDTTPLVVGREYILQMNSMNRPCIVASITSKIDVATFEHSSTEGDLKMNEFAIVKVVAESPVSFDKFKDIPGMGRGILIDRETNYTSGAFTIL